MKNKVIYTETALPLYEVAELTMEEALLALSTHKADRSQSWVQSAGDLQPDYPQHTTSQRQH